MCLRVKMLCILVFSLISCKDEEVQKQDINWNHFGLENHNINQLEKSRNKIIAASNKGLYQNSLDASSGTWQLLGFENENIGAFIIIEDGLWLASQVVTSNPEKSALYQSTNQGESWQKMNQHFGGENAEPLNDFAYDEQGNLLYGTGTNVIAVSDDEGHSWTPIYGDWASFGSGVDVIELNPDNPNEIWAGGQGAIENGFLLRSTDSGENWKQWQNLVDNPTVVKTIVFHPDNSNRIMAGFEGALLQTNNNGETWNTLIDSDDNRFFFGAAYSKNYHDRIYAAGWLKEFDNPQPLKLFISDDNGKTWRTEDSDITEFGGVTEMLSISSSDADAFLLGLWKGGVVKVSVEE